MESKGLDLASPGAEPGSGAHHGKEIPDRGPGGRGHIGSGGLSTRDLESLLRAVPSLVRGVEDAERIDQVELLERIKSACSAQQARVTVDLFESRVAAERAKGVSEDDLARGLGSEVGLARRESPHAGSRHLGLARALDEMPHTLAALTVGDINEWRVTLMVKETAALSLEHRRQVDHALADRLPDLGDRALAAAARALACRLDAAAVADRAAKAEKDRRVTIRPAPDTMSLLTGVLPVAEGVRVFATLDKHAASLKANGDKRSRGQIMADTLVARVTGKEHAGDGDIEVQLIMPVETLLHGGDAPGHLMGYGPIPAPVARGLVTGRGPLNGRTPHGDARTPDADHGAPQGDHGAPQGDHGAPQGDHGAPKGDHGAPHETEGLAEQARVWLRRVYASPSTGELVQMESTRREFGGRLRTFLVSRDQTCRTPWCDAPVRHVDHVVPVARNGRTMAGNGQGLCARCNFVKELAGWRARPVGHSPHTIEIRTPTGHVHRSHAPPAAGPVLSPLERWYSDVLAAA